MLGDNYDEAFLAFSLEAIEIIHSSGYMRILRTGLVGRGGNQSDLSVLCLFYEGVSVELSKVVDLYETDLGKTGIGSTSPSCW